MALIAERSAHLHVTLQRSVRAPLLSVPRGMEPRGRLAVQRTFAAVQEAGIGKGAKEKRGSGGTDKPEVFGKSDLTAELASRTGLGQKSAKEITDTVLRIIEQQVGQGKKVVLVGFGSFQLRVRAPRKVRNPRTGEYIASLGGPASPARFDTVAATHAAMTDVRVGVQEAHIGTTVSPAFSAGKAFKTAVQTAYFGKEANGSNETEEP